MAEDTTLKRGYTSRYQDKLDELYGKIESRKPFQYDVNADAMYQQLKDQYVQGGRMAMMDTMGQAQAMTGGYGNSYAQGAGQQAYQGYLRGITDNLPQLYDMAMSRYNQQGQELQNLYAMTSAQDQKDYARWQDQQALAMQQVNAMLEKGITPSQELLQQSALAEEYVKAMRYTPDSGGSGRGGAATVDSEYEVAKKIAAGMHADGKSYASIVNVLRGSGLSANDVGSITERYIPKKLYDNIGKK